MRHKRPLPPFTFPPCPLPPRAGRRVGGESRLEKTLSYIFFLVEMGFQTNKSVWFGCCKQGVPGGEVDLDPVITELRIILL